MVLAGTGALALASALVGRTTLAEAARVDTLVVDASLAVRQEPIVIRPIGRHQLEIEVGGRTLELELDQDGLPRDGVRGRSWPLET